MDCPHITRLVSCRLLRELIRRRLVYSELPDRPFDDLWQRICVSHVAGEESSQFLIDRCLMRPRALIDLANHFRGFAVNLGHTKMEVSDIEKGSPRFPAIWSRRLDTKSVMCSQGRKTCFMRSLANPRHFPNCSYIRYWKGEESQETR
jgi:hypothetical protein